MRKLLIILFIFSLFFAAVFEQARADGGLEISPLIIDEKAKASEIIERIIKIKNNTEHKVSIYPTVNDLSMSEGKQEFLNPSSLDKTISLARWIRIKRAATQIMPGEEMEVPFSIEINQSAVPGKRYAIIFFPSASNRPLAEAKIDKENVPQIMVNVEIEDETVEKIQLINFSALAKTYFTWPIKFSVELKNIGNIALKPEGQVLIYNRREQYLDSLKFNEMSESIEAGEQKKIYLDWNAKKGIGKFKAKLELEYGEKDRRDLADTVYFWILPIPFVLFFVGGLFLITAFLVIYLFRKTYSARHHAYKHKPIQEDGVLDLKNDKL
ncbi:hypothetical protein KAI65_03475 [Candidatus Parcubacteria bacterium]|nr:hypothetical protein [Candidatus Parcubacteria bacterium]